MVPIVLFLFREEPHNGLRRRCLLGALFTRAGAGTDLPAVEQDMNVKFLAVVRASLRDELIAQLLRFFALHELLQLRLIIVGLFRLGELRQDEPRHDVAGHGKASVQIAGSHNGLHNIAEDARAAAAAALILAVSEQQMLAERETLRHGGKALFADELRADARQIAFEEPYEAAVTAADLEKILGMPKFLKEEYEVGGMTGVVTGLAWTEVGGDILYIESVLTPGKGKVSLTGNLGDVMKESATIAHEWVMAHSKELGIDPALFEKNDINIHVPEGAIPKDGPSAGITMVTSIVSTYTGRKVRDRIAMTGETTLRGRVMPVGGVKEKILAAKRAGINELILSEENRKDIAEIKPEYIDGLTFHYVKTNDEVLKQALI